MGHFWSALPQRLIGETGTRLKVEALFGFLNKIYHFQVNSFKENDHRIVKLANLLGFLGFTITSLYSLFYYTVLDSTKAALFNEFFAFCYLAYYYFLSKGKLFPALLSIIITFLSNLFFVVVFFASNQSGFHYFYFLSGPTLYFFLTDERKIYRVGFSVLAFVLFLICEMWGDTHSYLVLSDTHFKILYYSTIAIVFVLLLVITHTFQREIVEREKKLEKVSHDQFLTNVELEKENMEREQAQRALEREKKKLEDALLEIKQLSGLLPICASCKKIRDDKGRWGQIETYIAKRSDAKFSHSICPECKEQLYSGIFNLPSDD